MKKGEHEHIREKAPEIEPVVDTPAVRSFGARKDRKKKIRTIFEIIVLVIIGIVLLKNFVVFDRYDPYDSTDKKVVTGKDAGFLAISYFGVDREGTDTLVSTERLGEQLKALHRLGYVTITQKDILDYYNSGKKLPEKAVYLLFEDGRTDTAIFSEPYLEKYNYIGTVSTYGKNLKSKDNKFLSGKDLKKLEKTSYWETASNGYRLAYINVFDRHNRYLGQLTAEEYMEVHDYLGRNYNHYLMDYLRGENNMPIETYAQMEKRISHDYDLMKSVYTKELGYVPQVSLLMHANTDRYGNNLRVSSVNEANMTALFRINFNREGYSLNTSDNEIFDLTRMQSQAYWYTNHLLMRMKDDLKDVGESKNITFEHGDKARYAKWRVRSGAAEMKTDSIVLTTPSKSGARMKLKKARNLKNAKVSVEMKGNLLGTQTVYLRADNGLKHYVSISLQEKHLLVSDSGTQIADVDLDKLKGVQYDSVEEDDQKALAQEYAVRSKYAGSTEESFAYKNEENAAKRKTVRSVSDGADPYIPEIQISDAGDWNVRIALSGDRLSVRVDGKQAVKDLKVSTNRSGSVVLGADWLDAGTNEIADREKGSDQATRYSQRNTSDDVYDGVFSRLVIRRPSGGEILYDDRLHGFAKFWNSLKKHWHSLITRFIMHF